MAGPVHSYLVALGSNMRVAGVGGPRQVLEAALARLAEHGIEVIAASRILSSRPVGPSQRSYANAVAVAETRLEPPGLLDVLQDVERAFGRRRRGSRWRARPLDLDIVLWSGGVWHSPRLVVPHPQFRARDFVLRPAAEVAADWRDPVSGLTLRQLSRRLSAHRPSSR